MRYQRTFHLSAAHFNSKRAYEMVWFLFAPSSTRSLRFLPDNLHGLSIEDALRFILTETHGHNFEIIVVVGGKTAGDDWLIDDLELTKAVMEWNSTNLSMHPDFLQEKLRATTENMVLVLERKLKAQFGASMIVGVWVYETDDIFAGVGEKFT